MTAPSKAALFVLLLAAAAVGIGFILTAGNGSEAPPAFVPAETPEQTPQPPEDEPAAALTGRSERAEVPDEPQRTEVDLAGPGDELNQGVTGRIVDPRGAPVVGTEVFLMEGTGLDLFTQLMRAQKGVRIPPVAQDETDEQGVFALGVDPADPSKRYEVRIVSDSYVDHTLPNITVKEGEWYDAGTIQLERGAVLHGRVTIEGSNGLPVPDARVMVQSNPSTMPTVSPTPGREEGLVAMCDPTGSYRLENVPVGVVHVAAVAPGYARIEKQNTTIDANAPTRVDFELPAGVSIAGVVVEAKTGKPVAGAKVEATAISSKTPARGTARTDRDGRFEIIGLVDSPYMLTAIAPGYVRDEQRPIEAGDQNVQVFLETQGAARVRVYDKNSRIMRRFRLTVKTFFPGQDQFGNADVPTQQARADKSGIARVEGLDPGEYVFQIEASGHAKAFSDPFKITAGGEEPLVEVRLNEGGKLEGRVVDGRGKPVSGVRVVTLPNHMDENPFTQMFAAIIPYKITRTSTSTDAQGHYSMSLLAPGPYQLKFVHGDYYEVHRKGVQVQTGQTTKVPTTTMERGTIVSGVVTVDGSPGSQVKVTLSSVVDPQTQAAVNGGTAASSPSIFSADAITDNEGRFTISKRIPPGRYKVMAARQTLANPLLQIRDFHETQREITLGRGQEKFFLQIAITD